MGALDGHFGNAPWSWWARPVSIGAFLVSLIGALFLFNRSGFRPGLRRKSLAERISELDASGLLLRQHFRANRAFAVEEFEDEGLHYFIELTDGRVLFLSGQYLYDYEPIADEPELNQPRSFPSTEFEVLRHKSAGYVMEIRCTGEVLESELTTAPFQEDDFERGVPQDGDVIADRTYDEIKAERMVAVP